MLLFQPAHASKSKFVIWLAILALLFSMVQLQQAGKVQASSDVATLNPIEDTYVSLGAPDANNGNKNTINIWKDRDEALIKFNLGELEHVVSAKLRIYNAGVASARTVAVYGIDPSSWAENVVTWNATRPVPTTGMLDSHTMTANTAQYIELDVTEYVQDYSDAILSFQLQMVEPHLTAAFHSRTNTYRPELVITTEIPELNPNPVVGWSGLEPSEDSRVIYVSNSEGSDTNDGLTPEEPVQSITKARTMVRDGYPDWILLKRGDVWKDQTVYRFINGRSAAEPAVISYYGDSGARPLIKGSTYFVNTDGIVRNYQAFVGLHIVNYKMDPQDEGYTGSNNDGGMRFVRGGDFLLIEDCKLEFGELIIQGYEGDHFTNVKLYRNIVVDNYRFGTTTSGDRKPSGLFASGVDGLSIIENVFDHNGWRAGHADTHANLYNHNLYLQYDTVGATQVVRGNILSRASSHGAQGRSGGLFEDNLFVQNAVGMTIGHAGAPLASGTVRNNVVLDGKRMMTNKSDYPQTGAVFGIDVTTDDHGAISIEDNIVANRRDSGSNVGIAYRSTMSYSGNIQYNWGNGIGDSEGGLIGSWQDPSRSVGSYHATLGKTATLEAFLGEARNRGLGEWPEEYTAYAVNDYIREGFNEVDTGVRNRYALATSYASSSAPTNTNGNKTTMSVWKDQDVSYMKFDSRLLDNVVTAKLRVYNSAVTSFRNIAAYGVGNGWTESALNWNNRPAILTSELDTVFIDVGPAQYREFDVTDYVAEHTGDEISFALLGVEAHKPTTFQSRRGANPPQLIVTVGNSEESPALEPEEQEEPGEQTPVVGYSQLEPSSDSRIIYVSNSEGNDNNDGLSPEQPVKSITKARTMVRDGYPDWILLKRGDVWKDQDVYRFINGRSATEPAVISYYGDSGARPLIKASTNFVDTNGVLRNYQAFVGLHIVNYKMDPQDAEFTGSNNSGGMRFVRGGDYLLIEDCKLEFGELIIQGYEGDHFTNVKLYRNIVVDNYKFGTTNSGGIRPSGLFASGIDGLSIIENVFDHNGWYAGHADTQATMYNHNLYLQYDNVGETQVVRGNILSRASSHGAQGRSGGLFEDNLFVQNSIGMTIGHEQAPLASGTVKNNVVLDGKRMMADRASDPQTAAVYGIDVTTDAHGDISIEDNIVANRRDSGTNIGIAYSSTAAYSGNIQYNWGGGIGDMYGGDIGAWDDPTRSVGSYHATLGKTATLEAFLAEVRSRGLGEWPEEYTAYAVNEYIREGFVEIEGKEPEIIEEDTSKRAKATKGTVQIGETIDPGWSNAAAITDFVQSGAPHNSGRLATVQPVVKTKWDENYLYVLAEVKDEMIGGSSDPTLLSKTAIELYIDQTNAKLPTKTEGYLQIHIAYNGSVVNYTNGLSNLLGTEHGIKAASAITADGYVIAVQIPWTVDSLKNKDFIGFDISINEYNSSASRVAWIHWNDATSTVWQNASELGSLLLAAADSGKTITAAIGTPELDGEVDSIWSRIEATTGFLQTGPGTASVMPSFKTMWDDDYLYVLAEVVDNHMSEAALAKTAVELYIDLHNFKLDKEDKDYLQIHAAYDGRVVKYSDGKQDLLNLNHGIEAATSIASNGYTMEIKIPWKYGAPAAGNVIGFDISVNEYHANGNRKSWIHWNDSSSRAWESAAGIGNLVLGTEAAVVDPVEPLLAAASLAADKATAAPGQSVEWTIGAEVSEPGFTALEVMLAYDPQVLAFDVVNDNGVAYLADEALQATHAGYAIAGAVREDLGQIYILMFTNDNQLAISGEGPLFKLKGKVKEEAVIGQSTAISLQNFEVSMEGAGVLLDTEQASASLQVVASPTPANKETLIAKINQVQTIYNQAKTGTKIGQYREADKTNLNHALTAAKGVRDDAGASQSAVNAAEAALETARQTFASKIITLVEGATRVSVRDLSLIAKYYGIDSDHPDWNRVAAADIDDEGVITIETLATVARMILSDWATGQ